MIKFLFYLLISVLFIFLADNMAYKFVRRIDKKERTKLQTWELNNIKTLKDSYGDKS